MSNIVVIAEVRGGQLKRPSLEAATAALQLASATGGKVTAIACGANLDAACAELQKSGVHQITAIEGAAFANYSGDAYAKAIADQAKAAGATGVLMAHTAMGKDLLPRVAALLEGSITTDAVAVSFANGSFTAQKPVFSGKATMTVRALKAPFCVTLRPNNFAAASGGGSAATTKVAAPGGDLLAVVKEIIAAGGGKTPLQEAKVVVAGGRGLANDGTLAIRLRALNCARRACISCREGFEGHHVELVIEDSGAMLSERDIRALAQRSGNDAPASSPLDDLAEIHALVHSQGGHLQIQQSLPAGNSLHVFLRAASTEQQREHDASTRTTVTRFPFVRLRDPRNSG